MTAAAPATKKSGRGSTRRGKDIGKQVDETLKKNREKRERQKKEAEKAAETPTSKDDGFNYAGDKLLAKLLERYAAGESPLSLDKDLDHSKYPEMPNRVPAMGLIRRHFAAIHGVKPNSKEFWQLWSESELGPMFHRSQLTGKAVSAPELKGVPSDENVPVIDNTRVANGWQTVRKGRKDHFVSPELKEQGFEAGCVFCIANPKAKADLIVQFPPEKAEKYGIQTARLKLVSRPKPPKAEKAETTEKPKRTVARKKPGTSTTGSKKKGAKKS